MPKDRISVVNFLRAGEIFLHEGDHYSDSETTQLKAMLRRVSAKVTNAKDDDTPK